MIGLLGGLGAALSWTVAALTAARASRAIKATPTLGWVMLIGLIVILPTLAFLDPGKLSGRTIGYLALAGTANVAGLALEYLALRVGKIGVVAPLCSTEGAIAAVIAAIFGQVPSTGVLITLAVIAGRGRPQCNRRRQCSARRHREGSAPNACGLPGDGFGDPVRHQPVCARARG